MKLSHIPIHFRTPVYLILFLIIILGTLAYKQIPRESQPDIQIPILIVTVPYPGASPADTESLITRKLEKEFKGIENLDKITSTSAESVSVIVLNFDAGFDTKQARTSVREAIDSVRPDLPDESETATIQEINLSETPILYVNLSSKIGLNRLRIAADDLKDEIEDLGGVLEVRRIGGLTREIQILLDPAKILHHKLDTNQIANAINGENKDLPGGSIDLGGSKYQLRIPGKFTNPKDIENALITTREGVPILIKDVGQVVDGFEDLSSRSRLNKTETVSLSVSKRSGENIFLIRDKVLELIKEEEAKYQGQIQYAITNDQTVFIESMVSDLENNIFTGFLMVFVVLLVFMGFRSASFAAFAIPSSFLLSIFILNAAGMTLNMMVLFSLILALGMLVDNAVVVIDNIYRHLQMGKTRIEASKDGISEVVIPVFTSSMTTIAAFSPLLFMPDIIGEFMSFIPRTVIIALSSSLFVGVIVIPAICSLLMRAKIESSQKLDSHQAVVTQGVIFDVYRKVLGGALRFKWSVMVGAFAVLILTIGGYIASRPGIEFMPAGEPGHVTINLTAEIGSSLETTDQYIADIEENVDKNRANVESFLANVGLSPSMRVAGASSHLGYMVIEFPTWQEWKKKPSEVIEEIREQLADFSGVQLTLDKEENGPPKEKPVNIEISGPNLNVLSQIARDIEDRIFDLKGIVDLTDDFDDSRSEIHVVVDRQKAAKLGLRPRDIGQIVRIGFNGRKIATFQEGKDDYDVMLKLNQDARQSVESMESLYIVAPSQQLIPIKEVASVQVTQGYSSIRHVNAERVVTVSAEAERIPGPVLLGQVKERLQDLELPAGYHVKYTGEDEQRKESQGFLVQSFFVALFLIFIILTAQFNSFKIPLIILVSVLLSLIGVITGYVIHDKPFSILLGGIGTVSLAGIVVNNAIVLLDFIQQLRKQGYELKDAIISAGAARLRPVLLTTITTIFGLLPILLGIEVNFYRWPDVVLFGSESAVFWKPFAISIAYGLAVSTILTLIVVPTLYYILNTPLWQRKAKVAA